MWHRGGSSKLGMLRRRGIGSKCNFPINMLLPDKQTSKWNLSACCPIAPAVPYILWLSKSQPLGYKGRFLCVSAPGAGPLSQGNPCSQWIDQTSSDRPGLGFQPGPNCLSLFLCLLLSISSPLPPRVDWCHSCNSFLRKSVPWLIEWRDAWKRKIDNVWLKTMLRYAFLKTSSL